MKRQVRERWSFACCLALAVGMWSCGDKNIPASDLHEAPDALNSYQRIGLGTKPYNAVRMSAKVPNNRTYWSGSYWPTYKGGVSHRWQQPIQSESYRDFLFNISHFQNYLYMQFNQLRQLSPAEKYDLWMSDTRMSLTNSERQKILSTAQSFNNTVPTWFGICDGWALASTTEAEPVKMVRAQSNSGQTIEFYPEDIKALMSYYYATAPKQFVTAGGRCNRKTVTKDAQGRVIESECRDINPATLHLALDRYVGDQNQKLVVDLNRDEQVWNYPIQSYNFKYNNLRDLANDPSYRHASPGTQFLVDVTLNVTVVNGMAPTAQLGPHQSLGQKGWRYVLELDARQNIIGGEWISDQHPDFLWIVQSVNNSTSRVDYRALSILANASR